MLAYFVYMTHNVLVVMLPNNQQTRAMLLLGWYQPCISTYHRSRTHPPNVHSCGMCCMYIPGSYQSGSPHPMQYHMNPARCPTSCCFPTCLACCHSPSRCKSQMQPHRKKSRHIPYQLPVSDSLVELRLVMQTV